jgi:hypothetical protein
MTAATEMSERIDTVFLVGKADGGAARLSALLNGHLEIVSVGAVDRLTPGRLRSETCSCGRALRDCPFWTRVLAGLAVRNYGLPAGGLYDGVRRAPIEAGRRLAAFAAALLDVSGKRIFVSASEDPTRLAALAANPELDLRAIRVRGNGHRMAVSPGRRSRVDLTALLSWRVTLRERRLRQVLMGILPEKRFELAYDEIIRDPAAAAARALEFLSADGLPDVSEPAGPVVERHLLGYRGKNG